MFIKYGLKGKLLICFLLLASFALMTGASGLYVLEKVRDSFDESIDSASKGLALQSERNSYLIQLREKIDRIKNAQSETQLKDLKSLINIAGDRAELLPIAEKANLQTNISKLYDRQMTYLTIENSLKVHQSEIIELLESVNPEIDKLVNQEIAKTIDMLNSALEDFSVKSQENARILKDKFSIFANVSENSLDTLEDILDIRAGVYYLASKYKNIFLYNDNARIDFARNEINVEIKRMKQIITEFDADESLTELSRLIEILENQIPVTIDKRKKILNTEVAEEPDSEKQKVATTIGQDYFVELDALEKLIEQINSLVWTVADDIGFDAILEIENATGSVDLASLKYSEDIASSLNNLADTTKAVMAEMQVAESLKSALAKLNSNVRDVMLAQESSQLDFLQSQISDEYKNINTLYNDFINDSNRSLSNELSPKIDGLIATSRLAIDSRDKVSSEIVRLADWLEKVDHDSSNMAQSLQDEIKVHLAETSKSIHGWQYILVAIASGSFIVALILGTTISRLISRRVNNVTENLNYIVKEIAETALSIQTVSQNYSEGATSQATGLQETIASLLEMTSSIKMNTGNSQRANKLVDQAANFAGAGHDEVVLMSGVMKEINTDSRDTSVVIKTINEIAFQTNLLALNAAVEAARAGEAGKGFAVVAEEVRNLALKASEAANSTSTMLESAIHKTEKGVEVSDNIASLFESIVNSIGQTNELMDEIARASTGQDVDIENIKNAVVKMDQVTQNNAALAHETATTSESLNANIEVLNEMISDLLTFVHGK